MRTRISAAAATDPIPRAALRRGARYPEPTPDPSRRGGCRGTTSPLPQATRLVWLLPCPLLGSGFLRPAPSRSVPLAGPRPHAEISLLDDRRGGTDDLQRELSSWERKRELPPWPRMVPGRAVLISPFWEWCLDVSRAEETTLTLGCDRSPKVISTDRERPAHPGPCFPLGYFPSTLLPGKDEMPIHCEVC